MPVVTLILGMTNDLNRVAQRHVTKEVARGRTPDDVVREAWRRRHDPVVNAITTRSWTAPSQPYVSDISYDSAIVGDASEAEVMEALIKAGKR